MITSLSPYYMLFIDSLKVGILWFLHEPFLLIAMKHLGDYSLPAITIIATIGSTLGSIVSWGIGYLMRRWLGATTENPFSSFLQRCIHWVQRWSVLVSVLGATPRLGASISCLLGFIQIPWYRAMAGIALGYTIYYISKIFLW